jgi:surface protein
MSLSRFQHLDTKNIVRILEAVFSNATEEETKLYTYNIANTGIFQLLNEHIKMSPIGNNVVDLLKTKIWLRLIDTMGMLEGQTIMHLPWHSSIRDYMSKVIREHRYTSRTHDLLSIARTSRSVKQRELARCLLHNLITPDSSELDRSFLIGNILDIQVLTNDTMEEAIIRAIDENDVSMMKYWDVREVTDMSRLFDKELFTTETIDLSYWDTSNVTTMDYMFLRTRLHIVGLSNWNTSNVTTMNSMFFESISFNQPLNWNTSNVTDMYYMFSGASSFNQPLEWDTSKVIDMICMFENATSFNQPLHWNTSNVERMFSMFEGATSFNQVLDWNIAKVKPDQLEYVFEDSEGRWKDR